jgi:hypothetical protein
MAYRIYNTTPPHREGHVAEVAWDCGDGYFLTPIELFVKNGQKMIAMWPAEAGEPWELPLLEFMESLNKARALLESFPGVD